MEAFCPTVEYNLYTTGESDPIHTTVSKVSTCEHNITLSSMTLPRNYYRSNCKVLGLLFQITEVLPQYRCTFVAISKNHCFGKQYSILDSRLLLPVVEHLPLIRWIRQSDEGFELRADTKALGDRSRDYTFILYTQKRYYNTNGTCIIVHHHWILCVSAAPALERNFVVNMCRKQQKVRTPTI